MEFIFIFDDWMWWNETRIFGAYGIVIGKCRRNLWSLGRRRAPSHKIKEASSTNTEHIREYENRDDLSLSVSPQPLADHINEAYIEHNEGQYYTYVLPAVIIENIETGFQELVCGSDRAKSATTCGIWIGQITTSKCNEIIHVLSTCLARRRIQANKFNRWTSDVLSSDRWGRKKQCQLM